MHRGFAAVAVGVGLCAFLACETGDSSGTGPGNGGGPGTGTQIRSTAALDGWVRSDGNFSTTGVPITGDLDAAVSPSRGYRQFYSFDLSSFTSVSSATLRLYQADVVGSPYGDLGNVVVDHLDYGDLDPSDYSLAALASAGTLSTDATIGYKELNVTARVQADLAAGRTRAQFRIRFSTVDSNNDAGNDYASFTDGEFAGNNFPMLVVK